MGDMQMEERMKKYGKKCRTCQHWVAPLKTGRSKIRNWSDNALDQYDFTTGKCIKYSINEYSNPEDVYEKGSSSSDEKSCTSWEINHNLKYEYEQFLVKTAREQKEREEKEQELKKEEEILIKVAEQGDSEAQFNLGKFYISKYRKYDASIWFKKAAAQGHNGAINELNNMEKIKIKNERNKIIRYIMGSVFGGILGFILSFTMLHPQINIISIVIGVVVGIISGFFISKLSEMVLTDAILGAIFFGITFAIIYAIFAGSFLSGLLNGAIYGAICGVIYGVSCIKFRE